MNTIIAGKSRTGKTTELIKLAGCRGRIVCATEMNCKEIQQIAQNLNIKIKKPITMQQLVYRFSGRIGFNEQFLFDDIIECIQTIIPFNNFDTVFSINDRDGSTYWQRLTSPNNSFKGAKLTKREYHVFFSLIEGLSNPKIGKIYNISRSTVDVIAGRLYKKFGVKNRFELAWKYYMNLPG